MSKKRNEVLRKQLLKKRLAARAKSADKQSSGAPLFTKIIIGILVVILFGGVFIYFDGQRAGQAGLVPEKSLGLGEKLDVKIAGNNWKVQLDTASKTTIELTGELVPKVPEETVPPKPTTSSAAIEVLPPGTIKKELKKGECINQFEALLGKKYNICVESFYKTTISQGAVDVAVLKVTDIKGSVQKDKDIILLTTSIDLGGNKHLIINQRDATQKSVTLIVYVATVCDLEKLVVGGTGFCTFFPKNALPEKVLDIDATVGAGQGFKLTMPLQNSEFPSYRFDVVGEPKKGINLQIFDEDDGKLLNAYFLKPNVIHTIDVPYSYAFYNAGVYHLAVKFVIIDEQKVRVTLYYQGFSSPVELPKGTYSKSLHEGECLTFISAGKVNGIHIHYALCLNDLYEGTGVGGKKQKMAYFKLADDHSFGWEKPTLSHAPGALGLNGTTIEFFEGDLTGEQVMLRFVPTKDAETTFAGTFTTFTKVSKKDLTVNLIGGKPVEVKGLGKGVDNGVVIMLPDQNYMLVVKEAANDATGIGWYTFNVYPSVSTYKAKAGEKVYVDVPAGAPGYAPFNRMAVQFPSGAAKTKDITVKLQFVGFPSATKLLDTGVITHVIDVDDGVDDCFSFSYAGVYLLCTTVAQGNPGTEPVVKMKIYDSYGKEYPEIVLVSGGSMWFKEFAKVIVGSIEKSDTTGKLTQATISVKLHENPLKETSLSKNEGILEKTVKDELIFTVDEKPYKLQIYGDKEGKFMIGIRDITQTADFQQLTVTSGQVIKLDEQHVISLLLKPEGSLYKVSLKWIPLSEYKPPEASGTSSQPASAEPTLTNTLDTAVALNQEYVFKVGGELTNLKITKETGSKVAGGNNYGNTGVVIQIGGKKSQTILWEKGLVPWGTVGQSTSFTKVVTPGGNAFYLSITKTGGNEYVIWLTSDEFKNALQSNLPGTINSLITFNDKVIVTFTNVKSTAPLVYNVGGTVTLTIDGKKQSFKVTKITHVIGTTRFKNNNFDGTTQYASDNVPVITPLDSAELIVSKVTQQSITVAVEKEFKKKKSAAEQAGQTPQEGISQQGGSVPSGPSGKPFPKVPPGQPGPPSPK